MTEPKIVIGEFTDFDDVNCVGISMTKDDVFTLLIVKDNNNVIIYHKGERKEITVEQLIQAILTP